MGTLLAIANADAGTADDTAVEAAVSRLRNAHDVTVVRTATPDDLDEVLGQHRHIEGVIVLGGDGSLHAVVAALRSADRMDVPLGLIPLGTGNDFAATLGLPADPSAAADVIVAGRTGPIDLLLDGSGQIVINVAHVGLGAEAANAARPFKKFLGPIGYVIGATITSVKGLASPGSRVAVELDGHPVPTRRRVLQIAVGNGRFVGGGAPLLPAADPSDGRLDLMITFAGPVRRRLTYAWKLRSGEQRHHDDVVYLRGTEVTVSGDPLASTSDGELAEPQTHHAWTVLPAALTMWREVEF